MKSRITDGIMPNNHLVRIALVTTPILSVPLMAMQFSGEVNWTMFDFVVIGTLIFGTGLMLDLAIKKTRNNTHRVALGVLILAVFLYIWAELAVGIFTNWGS